MGMLPPALSHQHLVERSRERIHRPQATRPDEGPQASPTDQPPSWSVDCTHSGRTPVFRLVENDPMLGNRNAIATVAVKDLAAARKFYAEVLGLKPIAAEGDEVVTFQSGD